CSCICVVMFGQAAGSSDLEITPEMNEASQKWMDGLYEHGVKVVGDSMTYNEESRMILKDSTYRNFIYPEKYTWNTTQALLKKMALKQAFWYLVNLYNADPKHKEMVLKVIIPFDQMLEMDKVIISSFYSYIPFDPEVSIVENGMTTAIIRPDLAEQKLLAAKEVVNYIRYYRTEQKKK
ncbi:MAG: hypothetical protein ACI9VN_003305, partial [Patescibacteria group bacterium]